MTIRAQTTPLIEQVRAAVREACGGAVDASVLEDVFRNVVDVVIWPVSWRHSRRRGWRDRTLARAAAGAAMVTPVGVKVDVRWR